MAYYSTALERPAAGSLPLMARMRKHVVQVFGEARAATAHSSLLNEF